MKKIVVIGGGTMASAETVELTIQISYQDGSWWVIADNALLDAISGGILY